MLNRLLHLVGFRKDRSAEAAYLWALTEVRAHVENMKPTGRLEFVLFTLRQRHYALIQLLAASPPIMHEPYLEHIKRLDWINLSLASDMLSLVGNASKFQARLNARAIPAASGTVGAWIGQPFQQAALTAVTAAKGPRAISPSIAASAAKEAADAAGQVAGLKARLRGARSEAVTKEHLLAAIDALDEQLSWITSPTDM